MRKIVIILCFLAMIGIPLFAQDISPENFSEMFYVNIRLEKIYPTRTGYIIQYRKGVNGIGSVGVPNEWFTMAGSKAELITLPRGKNWPSMSVFYHEGAFSHIKLYVHPSKSHETWGNVPLSVDVSSFFTDSENFSVEFE